MADKQGFKKIMESTLLEIAKELRSQDFEQLKLLCGEKVPRTVLRQSTTPIELVKRLHGMGLVTCSSADWLRTMLKQIDRYDIADKLFSSDEPGTPTNCIQLGLPRRVTNFVRDEERVQIVNCLTNEDHAVTVVVADGGMGKTALVNEVGHSLAEKGTSVVYFSLRGLHTVEEGASQFLKLFDLRPGENPEKEVINLAHELKEETVIIVDNIDHLMESSVPYFRMENDILTFISEIAASQDNVKILATSRKEVNSVEWHNFTLNPISEEKAIKLLQVLNCSLDVEQATYRATLSSGSPLHLIMLASIKTQLFLQSVPELPDILAVWFEELGDLRDTALKLTVFPTKFTLSEVKDIFNLTESTEMLVSWLDKLTDRCLLTKNGDCYAIHSSIKSFLESHATKTDVRKEVLKNAREKFILFQISKLDDMYQQFLSPEPDPAITEFGKVEKHLVEAALKTFEGWSVSEALKQQFIDIANNTIEFLSKVMSLTELEYLFCLFSESCRLPEDQRRLGECYTSIGVKIIYSCTCQVLCSHIKERALEYLKKADNIQESIEIEGGHAQSRAQCLGKLGRCYAVEAMESEKYKDEDGTIGNSSVAMKRAEALVDRAVNLKKKRARERPDLHNKISLAISYHDKAAVLSCKQDHRGACNVREEHVLPIYKTNLRSHPFTATLFNSIGKDYFSLGDNRTAMEFIDKALVMRKKHLGENHQETARSYHDLGVCLARDERYEDALLKLNKALEIQRWVGDVPHEEIKTSEQIIKVLKELHRFQEVGEVKKSILDCKIKILCSGRPMSFRNPRSSNSI